jgi:hypothetical protein
MVLLLSLRYVLNATVVWLRAVGPYLSFWLQ